MIRRAAALVPALVFLPLLVLEWHGDGITPLLRATGLVFLIVSAVSPMTGLLALAGLLPVATQLQVAAHAPMSGAQVAELMIVAFLVGDSLRNARAPAVASRRLVWPATLVAAVVIGAGVVQLGVEQQATTATAPAFFGLIGRHVMRSFFSDISALPALHLTMTWIEGLLLAVVAERLLQSQPQRGPVVARMFVVGATAAGVCAVLRLIEISTRTGDVWASTAQFLRAVRLNPHYPDLNAGGSYYVLCLVPAVWLAFKRRLWAWPASAVILLALWLTGSRSAMVAGVIILAVAWIVDRRPKKRALVVAGLIAVVAAIVVMRPRGSQTLADETMHMRIELMKVGLRMAATHPMFGVGPGQFRAAAGPFVTPWLIGQWWSVRGIENSHNQFVQILAELGAVGLLAFLGLLAAVKLPAMRSIVKRTASPELVAMAWGLVAFFISSLLGHPLLTTQVLFATFLAIGITAGLVPEPAPAPGRRLTWLVAGTVTLLAISVPFRIDAARRGAFLDNVMIGVSGVRDTLDNVRYRAVEPRAVWFVAATTTSVTLPLRQAPGATTPCRVSVTVDGAPVTEASPTAEQWLRVELPLPASVRSRASRAISVTSGDGCQLIAGPLVKR
jgi:hypothetical protein